MSTTFSFHSAPFSLDQKTIETKLAAFEKITGNPSTQFFNTFLREDLVKNTIEVVNHFGAKKYFIHVGIGGSSLGPEMVVSALKKNQTQFIWINNIDPDEIYDQLKPLINANLKDCLFYFVSKSGGTAETLATLAIISQFLEVKGAKQEDFNQYFVFATDPKKSELLNIAKELNIKTLEVPSDVGGRFSVLTPVGYLPAIYAGLNIDLLLQGAKDARADFLKNNSDNPLVKSAELIFNLYQKKNINQTVLMPYSSKLRNLSFWFTQLWAESLGKKKNTKGETIHSGITPLPSYGATDQHSQLQLFAEGPNDKLFIIIEVENFTRDFELSSSIKSNNLEKLSGFRLSELLKAELEGTLRSLLDENRNIIKISIKQNDEYHLAQLILFFESLTALMGDYLMIDPFDQPGVEASKIYAFEYLKQL